MTPPIVLTRRGWSCLLAVAGFWAAQLLVGLRDIWYLVAFFGALLLIGVTSAVALPRLARCEAQLSSTDPTPVAGSAVTVTALIRHRAPFALRGSVLWESGDSAHASPLTLARGETTLAELGWRVTGRGPFTIRVPALMLLDPLGLVARRVPVEAQTGLLILPRTLDALAERLGGAAVTAGAGGLDGHRRLGGDAGTPAGAVREYRSGDPLRRIHWKQSARQGELLVNLHETAGGTHRTLLLEHGRDAFDTAAEFELAVSAAATLASHWLREGHPVRLHLSSEPPVHCTSESEMLRALAFARLHAGEGSRSLPELAPPPHAVVVGTLRRRLAAELAQLDGGGILLAHRQDPAAAVPRHWRPIAFSAPAEQEGAAGDG